MKEDNSEIVHYYSLEKVISSSVTDSFLRFVYNGEPRTFFCII